MVRLLAWVVVIVGAICAIAYYTYVDVWVVPTDDPRLLVSIEPTLHGGDVLLVERHGTPTLGNLARCTDPDEPRRFVVGRIVGVGGSPFILSGQTFSTAGSRPRSDSPCDSVRLTNPANGEEVALTCRNEQFAGMTYEKLFRVLEGAQQEADQTILVQPHRNYLLSDDRYIHLDSRDFGTVPDDSCRHILFRLWGADGFTDGAHRFNIIW